MQTVFFSRASKKSKEIMVKDSHSTWSSGKV